MSRAGALPIVLASHALHRDAAALLDFHAALRIASQPTAASLEAEAREASVLIVRAPVPATLFDRAPRLRAVIRHGAGLDQIPIAAATRAGVLVANVPGVNARSVAEYVAFVLLALARRFRIIDRDLRRDGWAAGRAQAETQEELAGRSVGIIGPGHVGRAVQSLLAQGFGMRVLAHGPDRTKLMAGMAWRSLDDLLAEADVVVLCCPLTEATRGLLDGARIARMKPGAWLVNVARGAVIEDAALIAALRSGQIGAAALDVFAEQPLPADHPYLGFENVIVTPHLAGLTTASMRRMGIGAVEEALRVLGGGMPVNLVNPEAVPLYTRSRQAGVLDGRGA